MEPKERIIEIIEKSGLTPSEFADRIGVQRSAISHITSGRNNPSLDFLIKIKNEFPEIDTDWLIFGIEKDESKTGLTEQHPENKTVAPVPQPSLFSDSDFETEIKNRQPHESESYNKGEETKTPAQISRVIIFYEDGSFEDYFKRK